MSSYGSAKSSSSVLSSESSLSSGSGRSSGPSSFGSSRSGGSAPPSSGDGCLQCTSICVELVSLLGTRDGQYTLTGNPIDGYTGSFDSPGVTGTAYTITVKWFAPNNSWGWSMIPSPIVSADFTDAGVEGCTPVAGSTGYTNESGVSTSITVLHCGSCNESSSAISSESYISSSGCPCDPDQLNLCIGIRTYPDFELEAIPLTGSLCSGIFDDGNGTGVFWDGASWSCYTVLAGQPLQFVSSTDRCDPIGAHWIANESSPQQWEIEVVSFNSYCPCDCADFTVEGHTVDDSLSNVGSLTVARGWRKTAEGSGLSALAVGALTGTYANIKPSTSPSAVEDDNAWDVIPLGVHGSNANGTVTLKVCSVTKIRFKVTCDKDTTNGATVTFKLNDVGVSGAIVNTTPPFTPTPPSPTESGGVVTINALGGGSSFTYEIDLPTTAPKPCYSIITVTADFNQNATDEVYCRLIVEEVLGGSI